MREWSTEHSDDLWATVVLPLTNGRASGAGAEVVWLKRHIANVCQLQLTFHEVSSEVRAQHAAAKRESTMQREGLTAFLQWPSSQRNHPYLQLSAPDRR